jgi:hypothetical protein
LQDIPHERIDLDPGNSPLMKIPLEWRAAALSLVPMSATMAGAWFDERTHLGFSNWRSACRASGLSFTSWMSFTFDLLPYAMTGALFGIFALQFAAAALWYRVGGARAALAPHAGCALGMTVGLPLCALTSSVPAMLIAEALIAGGTAVLLCRKPALGACRLASVSLRTPARSDAY